MKITYPICRAIRALTGKRRPYTTAILLAGGIGSRMTRADGKTKQLIPICGVPMLVHAVRAFSDCSYIDDIVIVAREEELSLVREMMETYGVAKIRRITAGGETRQESSLAGFEAIDAEKCRFVAIHDAARCLIRPEQIADVVSAAYAHGAAAAACRIYDTVKRANSKGEVLQTLNREELWRAQTPQVFDATLYRAAAYTAKAAGFAATDDTMLCERLGQTVRLVDCGAENIKVTVEEDLWLAEATLRQREEKK